MMKNTYVIISEAGLTFNGRKDLVPPARKEPAGARRISLHRQPGMIRCNGH